jgi:hypothetical protein
MLEWPMNVESALALTPAAMNIEAQEWRHSWSEMLGMPAFFQALSARILTPGGRAFASHRGEK